MQISIGREPKSIPEGLAQIDELITALNLDRGARETAAYIFRRAQEEGILRGHSVEEMVAASLYMSCRNKKVAITLKQLGTVAKMNPATIGRVYVTLSRELQIKHRPLSEMDYLPQFSQALSLPDKVREKAIELIENWKKQRLMRHQKPSGIAAVAIYTACLKEGHPITQREVARVSGISEITLRNVFKRLVDGRTSTEYRKRSGP